MLAAERESGAVSWQPQRHIGAATHMGATRIGAAMAGRCPRCVYTPKA